MIDLLHAPFTPDEVASLNAYQHSGAFHPFTCPGRILDGTEHILEATEHGWRCAHCPDFTQNWCHLWMADWSWQKVLGPSGEAPAG